MRILGRRVLATWGDEPAAVTIIAAKNEQYQLVFSIALIRQVIFVVKLKTRGASYRV